MTIGVLQERESSRRRANPRNEKHVPFEMQLAFLQASTQHVSHMDKNCNTDPTESVLARGHICAVVAVQQCGSDFGLNNSKHILGSILSSAKSKNICYLGCIK